VAALTLAETKKIKERARGGMPPNYARRAQQHRFPTLTSHTRLAY